MRAALEMAWHPYFTPATANTRMDYGLSLNRPLFIALFKQTQVRTSSPLCSQAGLPCTHKLFSFGVILCVLHFHCAHKLCTRVFSDVLPCAHKLFSFVCLLVPYLVFANVLARCLPSCSPLCSPLCSQAVPLVFFLVFALAFSLVFSLVFALVFSLVFSLVYPLLFPLRFLLEFTSWPF